MSQALATRTRKHAYLDDLKSVALAGAKVDFPSLLRRKYRQYTSKELEDLMKMNPLDTLPRVLIPRSSYSWKPPVFQYGWEFDKAKVVEYAKKNGLAVYGDNSVPRSKLEGDEVLSDPTESETSFFVTVRRLDWMDTCVRVFARFCSQHNVKTLCRCALKVAFARDEAIMVLAVYNNYLLKGAPTHEELEVLQRAMGDMLIGEPKWWLDGLACDWFQVGDTDCDPYS